MTDPTNPETSRRGDVPSRPIRLSDGRSWGFARPSVRLTPKLVNELDQLGRPVERMALAVGFGYPPGIERLIEKVRSASKSEPVPQQYEAFFTLAASLLLRSHDISMASGCELLSLSGDELARLVREVWAVVEEVRPKPGADLSGESSHEE
jgi:hypothetical protein